MKLRDLFTLPTQKPLADLKKLPPKLTREVIYNIGKQSSPDFGCIFTTYIYAFILFLLSMTLISSFASLIGLLASFNSIRSGEDSLGGSVLIAILWVGTLYIVYLSFDSIPKFFIYLKTGFHVSHLLLLLKTGESVEGEIQDIIKMGDKVQYVYSFLYRQGSFTGRYEVNSKKATLHIADKVKVFLMQGGLTILIL